MKKMTRTQKSEIVRKQVDAFLKLHLPETDWDVDRSGDTIIINTHAKYHSMGMYSPFCARQDIENGKLLQDAKEHIARYR